MKRKLKHIATIATTLDILLKCHLFDFNNKYNVNAVYVYYRVFKNIVEREGIIIKVRTKN